MDIKSKEIFTVQFNSNISKDDNDIRIVFYANIGFFTEIAQMLEFNLRKLICYYKSVTEIEVSEITKKMLRKYANPMITIMSKLIKTSIH